MVEVNTKNWTKKKRALPPCGIPITDAENEYPCHGELRLHYPDLVNDGRKEVFELLKQAGFKSTRELVKGKWQDIAL